MSNQKKIIRLIVLVLGLAGLLVSCNKPSLPTSVFFEGELAEFSGKYPSEWPDFLTLFEGTYIDNGGEINISPSGSMGFHGVVKGSQYEMLKQYRQLIASNGYYFNEKTIKSVTHLTVKRSVQTTFFRLSIGDNGGSIDQDSVDNPEDWVCYMAIINSEDLNR